MDTFHGWIVAPGGLRPVAEARVEGEMMTVINTGTAERWVGRVARVDPDPAGGSALQIRLGGVPDVIPFIPKDSYGFLRSVSRITRDSPLPPPPRSTTTGYPAPPRLPPPPPPLPDLAAFRSPARSARITQILLLAFLPPAGWGMATSINAYRVISALIRDPLRFEFEVSPMFSEQPIAVLMLGASLVIGIALAVWTRRLVHNAERLGATPLRFRKGWAVWGWFVPIANLFIPLLVLGDVWKGSDPDSVPHLPAGWRQTKFPRLLGIWWGVWIATLVAPIVSVGGDFGPSVLEALRWEAAIDTVMIALWMSAAMLAAFVVHQVTGRQQARAEALARHLFPTPPSAVPSAPTAARHMGLPRLGFLAAGAVSAGIVLAVAGTSILEEDLGTGPGAATRGEDGAVTAEGSILLADLEVGDCFDLPEEITDPFGDDDVPILGILAKPCSNPHDAEAYAIIELEGGRLDPYPGFTEVDAQSTDGCLDSFEAYVGAAFLDSRLDLTWFYPQEGGWLLGDRTVHCIAFDPSNAPISGSLNGSGGIQDGKALYWSLRPGDCFDFDDLSLLLVMIECERPHDFEVYAVTSAPDASGDFPGDFELEEYGYEYCGGEFIGFVGVPVEESGLDVFPFTPGEYSWQLKNRSIRCILGTTGLGRLEGSMAGRGSAGVVSEG